MSVLDPVLEEAVACVEHAEKTLPPHDPPLSVVFKPLEVSLTVKKSGVKLDLRVFGQSTAPPPTRRGGIPPSRVESHTSRNGVQVCDLYTSDSINNRKRYKKALYHQKVERINKEPKRHRREAVRNSRDLKSEQFDRLTGIVPQMGLLDHKFGLDPEQLDRLENIAALGTTMDHKVKFSLEDFSELQKVMSTSKLHVTLDPEVLGTMRRMTDSFQEMFSNANFTASSATTVINSATNKLTDSIDAIMTGVTKILWIIPLLGAAYFASTMLPHFKTPAAIGAVGMVLANILPAGLWDIIKNSWPSFNKDTGNPDLDSSDYESFSDEDAAPQAGFFEPSTLGNVISMALTYLTIGSSDPMGVMKGLMKAMPSYSRNVDSWTKLSEFILQVVEIFVNFVRKQFGGDNISLMQTGVKAVDSWCARVMEVLNSSHTGGDIMNPDSVHLLCALRDEGRDLSNLYRFTREVSPILHRYLGQLDDLCRVCSAAMHSFKGGRPQPVVMALTGKPGVGKTYLCKMLTTMVLKAIITPERAKTLKYNFDSEVFMKGTTEFWNGYAGQEGVVFDDWGQPVPVAGGENDFMDLIRMANCWAYPLNFADVENKGKNFFKSSFILLTTNIKNIDNCQKVIVAPDAITRRINYGYELTVSPEFAKGGELDFSKVTSYIADHKEFPYHAWELRSYQFGIGNEGKILDPNPIGLKAVIAQVASSIIRNKSMFEDNSSMISDMLRRAYEEDAIQSQSGKWDATTMLNFWHEQNTFVESERLEEFKTKTLLGRSIEALKTTKEAVIDSADYIKIPYLANYRVKFKQLTSELLAHNVDLKGWIRKVLDNPIVRFLLGYSAVMLVISVLKAAMSQIFSWFKPAARKATEVYNAFRKKGTVPDPVLAQAINALEPSDFDEAVMAADGSYSVACSFSPEVLARAYRRITGTTIQSNEPTLLKFKHVKVEGRTVIESDIVRQGDGYGDDIANGCARNIYQIRVEAPEGIQTLGQFLMVRGTVGLMPQHFISMIEEAMGSDHYDDTAKVVCTNAHNSSMYVKYTVKQFLNFKRNSAKDMDCVAVNFESLRAHRDITKHFITQADLKSLSHIRIRIDTFEGREHFVHRIRHMVAKRHDRLEYGVGPTSQVIADSFEYTGYTKCGDCGGMATLQEFPSNCGRRIIGLHIAGNEKTGVGFCNIVTTENLNALIASFKVPEEYFPQGDSTAVLADAPIPGSFLGLNVAAKPHSMNPFTSLLKTPLHNAWGVNPKVPAKLGPFVNKAGEHIVPMAKALEGYASPVLHFDKEKVKAACYHAFTPTREATADTEKYPRKVFTFEEAVAGIEGTNINGIPRGTSPGYPHIVEGMTSKRPFFGAEGEYTFDTTKAKEMKTEVQRIINDAANNIRNPHFYTDFLKDELRAPEKVQAGKTRLISASPMSYVIAFRMYFLAFTSAVQDTRIRNGVAVGINHYKEWDELAKRMKSKGKCCGAGDFSGFDTDGQPQIQWGILDEINAWYDDGPVNALIRTILWLEVVHSRHFGGLDGKSEIFYQWNKNMSSGHPATSIINSFYVLVLFNLCWADIMGDIAAFDFWNKVYICAYGDDNILNIDEEVIDKFNQSSVTNSMKKFGMTYTNENKTGEVADYRPLEEISFLKRSFRYDNTAKRYVGPIELESALYTSYWCRSARHKQQNTKDNLEFSWLELALHEPEVWDKYAPEMRTIARERMGIEPTHYFTRDMYLKVALDMVPFWDK